MEETGDDVDVDVDIVEDKERDDGCVLGGFTTYVSRVAVPSCSLKSDQFSIVVGKPGSFQ